MDVSMVGLGIMGKPMARNLLDAGCRLRLFARNKNKIKDLQEAGAQVCASPAEAASKADFHLTMVSATRDVEQVVLGEDGICHGAARGSTVIDMSTISPHASQKIAETLCKTNINMLDAPVSGGEEGAQSATLSIMVGGENAVFDHALPLLQIIGGTVTHVGASGAGQVVKGCNQLFIAQNICALAEAMEYAATFGVDKGNMRLALLGGYASGRVLEIHGRRMIKEDYQPGFKSSLHLKDLEIVAKSCEDNSLNLPGMQQARRCLRKLVDSSSEDLDSAAIAKVVQMETRHFCSD